MEWQPIETVPKRDRVLVWRDDQDKVEIKLTMDFYHWLGHSELAYTHWMPLPNKPVEKELT